MADFEKALEDAKKKDFTGSYNMLTGVLYEDNKIKWSDNYTCMGGWSSRRSDFYRNTIAFVVCSRSDKYWSNKISANKALTEYGNYIQNGWVKTYYDYLTQESAWSPPHLLTDYNMIKGRAFLVSTGYDANLSYGACVATRFPYEFPDNFTLWCMLVERGCNKDLAFRIAHIMHYDYRNKVVAKGGAGHTSVVYNKSCSNIRGFVNHELEYEQLPFNMGGKRSSIDCMWKGSTQDDGFMKNLRYIPPGKDYYIFRCASAKKQDHVFQGEAGLEFLIESFTKKYMR